jgi:hypothetical protein
MKISTLIFTIFVLGNSVLATERKTKLVGGTWQLFEGNDEQHLNSPPDWLPKNHFIEAPCFMLNSVNSFVPDGQGTVKVLANNNDLYDFPDGYLQLPFDDTTVFPVSKLYNFKNGTSILATFISKRDFDSMACYDSCMFGGKTYTFIVIEYIMGNNISCHWTLSSEIHIVSLFITLISFLVFF